MGWILVIWFGTGHFGGERGVDVTHFKYREACEAAAHIIKREKHSKNVKCYKLKQEKD